MKHVPRAIVLSDEEIRQMTIEDIDLIQEKIQEKRDITSEEEKDLKWHKRRIMNRLSAKESRDRKQNKLQELSSALAEANSENERLQQRIRELESQLSSQTSVQHQPITISPNTSMDFEDSETSSSPLGSPFESANLDYPSFSFFAIGKMSTPTPSEAGICLFVMLLSIGLIFPFLHAPNTSNLIVPSGLGKGSVLSLTDSFNQASPHSAKQGAQLQLQPSSNSLYFSPREMLHYESRDVSIDESVLTGPSMVAYDMKEMDLHLSCNQTEVEIRPESDQSYPILIEGKA